MTQSTHQKKYDVAVVGAGLNGLATAAYLAKAGRSVIVLEARESVGGTMSTVDLAPGYRAPAVLDTVETLHPSLISELGLTSRLKLHKGGSTTVVHDASSVTRVDPGDPQLAELGSFVSKLGQALERVWTQPLPDVEPAGVAGVVDVLRMGWALRRLGKKDFPEALRFLPMCVFDILNEHLTDNAVKAAIGASALTAAWMAPRSPGSGYGLIHHCPPWAGGLIRSAVFAEGGPGAVSEAIAATARSAGAVIETGQVVTDIRVDKGRAIGVMVGDRLIEAGVVASALDPKTTLLKLAGPRWLDPDFVERTMQVRGRGGLTVIRLALDKLPLFAGGPETLKGRIQIGGDLDTIERAWDSAKYGELPNEPLLTCTLPTVVDNTLAPSGHHIMTVHVQFTPYSGLPSSGANDGTSNSGAAERDVFADRVIAMIEAVAPGFARSVLHRQVVSPQDIEAEFGLDGGCVHHADLALDQLLYMRPIPAWYGYRMPIEGLYLCGPGTHPGAAGTGLSGRNAATQILADLKR